MVGFTQFLVLWMTKLEEEHDPSIQQTGTKGGEQTGTFVSTVSQELLLSAPHSCYQISATTESLTKGGQ